MICSELNLSFGLINAVGARNCAHRMRRADTDDMIVAAVGGHGSAEVRPLIVVALLDRGSSGPSRWHGGVAAESQDVHDRSVSGRG
jgi:hypothetical protein